MKLIIGTDHNGVEIKKELLKKLSGDFEIIDASPENTPTDDYPDFAFKTSKLLLENDNAYGVLICGTGIGMCIAANKVKGIRCALVTSGRTARLARRDDDANVIALDSTMNIKMMEECIRLFASTSFCLEEEKYERRLKKVIDYENGAYDEL
ncbi:MAG: RpiB/LacA/LacB family sugar-phosphate isomerase [Bacilli bacterium]|nr:RpiB/LacA/LacB family sugar-phosphate isomerase [Bacilli bacterium]